MLQKFKHRWKRTNVKCSVAPGQAGVVALQLATCSAGILRVIIMDPVSLKALLRNACVSTIVKGHSKASIAPKNIMVSCYM